MGEILPYLTYAKLNFCPIMSLRSRLLYSGINIYWENSWVTCFVFRPHYMRYNHTAFLYSTYDTKRLPCGRWSGSTKASPSQTMGRHPNLPPHSVSACYSAVQHWFTVVLCRGVSEWSSNQISLWGPFWAYNLQSEDILAWISMDPSCLVSTVQAGGVMVWGIFSWHTLGSLVPIEHHLNTTPYWIYATEN